MSFEDIELPEEEDINENSYDDQEASGEVAPSGRFDKLLGEGGKKYKLSAL